MKNCTLQLEYTITKEDVNQRLDILLSQKFPEYTRSFFSRLISDGFVLINHVVQKKSGLKTKERDQIIVNVPQKNNSSLKENRENLINISVVFEHEHFLIINKPIGISVHQAHDYDLHFTLVDWLLIHYPELKNIGYHGRPGIVHRLDKNTSGIMIIPRTSFAHTFFSKAFSLKTIKKTYKALVCGITDQEGIIDFVIGRDPYNRIKMKAFKNEFENSGVKTREAKTEYKVATYFKEHTLLNLYPITGRTHQLRVHLAAIGHPILGDIVYGNSSLLISRQALHAFSLSFEFEKKEYYFETEIPNDMQKVIQILSD